ncbi:unnamed protein product [Brassicogethes aeneus]|uniref:Dual specificity protein phosphatase 23 n=1 Tax=Brassicogethes aeneus TaxID=1431903 RepID=A0A9P0AWH5_BRAAE|nr:unnamed protein product [Brassicogethes aeneus]
MTTKYETSYLNKPWNFSWVVEDNLAAMSCPQTLENLEYLHLIGIKHLITLSPEMRPPMELCPNVGWTIIPIEEFEAPRIEQIINFINICEKFRSNSEAVGIHCRMGRGRTGVMAACYLVRFMDVHPENAIVRLRLQRPGSIETRDQERAVLRYHDYLRTS